MFLLSSSQILIVGPLVPVQSSGWVEGRQAVNGRTHSMALESLPLEAQRGPSGLMVTVLR
jgi:hypothetical protein